MAFSFFSLLDCLPGDRQLPYRRMLKQLYEVRTEASGQISPSELGSRSPSSSQDFRWLEPQGTVPFPPHERPWARTTQIHDAQKLWNNKCLLFYVTKFQGKHTATDNQDETHYTLEGFLEIWPLNSALGGSECVGGDRAGLLGSWMKLFLIFSSGFPLMVAGGLILCHSPPYAATIVIILFYSSTHHTEKEKVSPFPPVL